MKKFFVLLFSLVLIISVMTVGMATAYSQTIQKKSTEIIVMKDIDDIKENYDLSNAAEKRDCFRDILLCMGIDEDWAERFAQGTPESFIDGIVNAEQSGGISKKFSNKKG